MFYLITSQCRPLFSLPRFICVSLLLSFAILSFGCAEKSVISDVSEAAKAYRPPAQLPGVLDATANQANLPWLDGGSMKFSELVGQNKVVLVNFWATWCGPCRREIPDLVALKQQFKGQDVEIVGLTVENPQAEAGKVRAFSQQFSINYKIGFADQQTFFLFNKANGADPRAPIPQTFIFDKKGKMLDSVRGLRRDFREWAEGAIHHALNAS